MAIKPSNEVMNAKNVELKTLDILTTTINEMKDTDLMQALVDAGLAEYVNVEEEE